MKTISNIKSAQFTTITPALASEWLEKNTENRRKRGTYITAMAAAMRRGEWKPTHQGIAFSKDGTLLDGQHRLEAIVKAKINLEMLVVVGLEPSSFSVIDVGSKRTMADTTNLPKRAAETFRFVQKELLLTQNPTAAQVSEIAQSGAEQLHEKLISYCGSTRAFYASAPMRAAALTLMFAGHDSEAVLKNYANMVLENFSEMNGLSQSLVRLVNAKKVVSTGSDSRMAFACGLKAMNPENSQMARLRVTSDDVTAAIAYGRSVFGHCLTSTV